MSVEENKAVIRRLIEELNTRKVDAGLDLFAADVAFNGRGVGREAIAQLRGPLWTAFPDLRFTLEDLLAVEDKVVARWTFTGTHQADLNHPLMGHIARTGKQITVMGMDIYRIAGGQIAEGWEIMDRLALLQQLGVSPAPVETTG